MYKTSTRKFDIYESYGTTVDGTNRIGYYGVRKFDRAEYHYFAKTLDEAIDHYMNFFNRNNHKGGDHWNIRQKGVGWEIDLILFNPELFFKYKDIFPTCYYEIVCLKCSKYILEKIYNKYNKMSKDENGDVNLNYIEGELQMCYDDVTFELEEVLFMPIYICKGDRINGESIKIPLIDIPKDFEIYGRKYT